MYNLVSITWRLGKIVGSVYLSKRLETSLKNQSPTKMIAGGMGAVMLFEFIENIAREVVLSYISISEDDYVPRDQVSMFRRKGFGMAFFVGTAEGILIGLLNGIFIALALRYGKAEKHHVQIVTGLLVSFWMTKTFFMKHSYKGSPFLNNNN